MLLIHPVREVGRFAGEQRSPSMYRATTRGIEVQVTPRFLSDRSSPENGYYFWAYTIDIANLGTETVQLKTRHWRITDASGRLQEVKGPGVVGEEPVGGLDDLDAVDHHRVDFRLLDRRAVALEVERRDSHQPRLVEHQVAAAQEVALEDLAVALDVPAAQVGLEGHVVSGMAFTLFDGRPLNGCTAAVSKSPLIRVRTFWAFR